MNAVIESLLDLVGKDPLPIAHTSSHWQRYGHETLVERRGDGIVLRAVGFTFQTKLSFRGKLLCNIERLSFRNVTKRLQSYRFVWKETRRLARDLNCGLGTHERIAATALAVLIDHLREYSLSPVTFAVIGDGDGFLGALIRRCQPGTRLYSIDLPKMLVFQAYTHEKADHEAKMSVLCLKERRQAEIVFVLPKDVESIPDQIDCAISIASMQEMTEFSVASYFSFLRRRSIVNSRFYCVSRLRKQLPGGEVSGFLDYPWSKDDEVFIDEPCPYYTHFFAPYTLPNGPRLNGMRVPYCNYFDGPLMHRLVHLAPGASY